MCTKIAYKDFSSAMIVKLKIAWQFMSDIYIIWYHLWDNRSTALALRATSNL